MKNIANCLDEKFISINRFLGIIILITINMAIIFNSDIHSLNLIYIIELVLLSLLYVSDKKKTSILLIINSLIIMFLYMFSVYSLLMFIGLILILLNGNNQKTIKKSFSFILLILISSMLVIIYNEAKDLQYEIEYSFIDADVDYDDIKSSEEIIYFVFSENNLDVQNYRIESEGIYQYSVCTYMFFDGLCLSDDIINEAYRYVFKIYDIDTNKEYKIYYTDPYYFEGEYFSAVYSILNLN